MKRSNGSLVGSVGGYHKSPDMVPVSNKGGSIGAYHKPPLAAHRDPGGDDCESRRRDGSPGG
jgi:hypothetical protein